METATVIHPFEPVWDERSRILILGSFPSVRSRMTEFYYGHPQNRFWPLLARLYGEDVPQTNAERRAFVLRHGIALWDAIESCRITGCREFVEAGYRAQLGSVVLLKNKKVLPLTAPITEVSPSPKPRRPMKSGNV